jgi:predicted permease
MSDLFLVFQSTFVNILQVFLVALAAGVLVRLGWVTQSHIQGLSAATVIVFLPCLTFANITGNFRVEEFPMWWLLPISAVVMIAAGLLLGAVAFCRELPEKKSMLSLASLQNAGYLVLPVGQALFPAEFDSRFSVYCFLYILGINPILWSVGKWLATSGKSERIHWRAFVTPPFVAVIVALVVALTGLRDAVPAPAGVYVIGPAGRAIHLLGLAAVPVATFVLGASLGSIKLDPGSHWWDGIRALGIKLLVIPALMVLVLKLTGWCSGNALLGAFFVIQAASAPATATILQIRTYGGDEQKIGSLLFAGYLLCAVTLPFWYALWCVVRV